MNWPRIFRWLWGLNFAVFAIVSLTIGGDAWSGHSINGHYFLGEKGKFTEVSRAIFEYSWWHMLSLIATLPIGLFAGYIGFLEKRDRASAAQQKRLRERQRDMSKN